jgi:predicted Holliday junction resolvase-like endonuclease
MSEILQANIFFFITSIAVIVFTFLLSVALFHLIKIMKSVRKIMERVEVESEAIADDVERLRVFITEESFLSRFFTRSERSHKEEDEEERPRRSSGSARKTQSRPKTELRIKNEE